MSVDTRTPRTPTGDRSSGIDDAPALSMVKVPSDPAQVIVNHASFRVQLGVSTRRVQSPRVARHLTATEDTARIPVGTAGGRAGGATARRRPVVWSGRSAPDDTGAHRLLQAVRHESVRHTEEPASDAGATQVISRPGAGQGGPGYGGTGYGRRLRRRIRARPRPDGRDPRRRPPAHHELRRHPAAARPCAPWAVPTTNPPTRTRSSTRTPAVDADGTEPAAAGATATTRPGTPTTRAAG